MFGIDVSEHNGTIDWSEVVLNDPKVEFTMIRCGWCGYDGLITKGIDKQYNRNMIEAGRLNIPRGVYVYSYAKTIEASRKAASQVLNLIKGYKLQMPIAFDIEHVIYKNMSAMENTLIVDAFCKEIEAAGEYVSFYCSTDFYLNHLNGDMLSRYDMWLADWTGINPRIRVHGIHQYSSNGKINGINGRVDLNLAFKNYLSIIGGKEHQQMTFADLKKNINKELDRYESLLG